jgi:hypothetical protein
VLMNNDIITVPKFQAKMTAIFLLILNGIAFHVVVLRFLEQHINEKLSERIILPKLWLFAATGAISVVSWYSALILGSLDDLGIPVWIYLILYFGGIFVAALVAYLVLAHLLFFRFATGEPTSAVAERVAAQDEESRFSWSLLLLIVLLLIIGASLVMAGIGVESLPGIGANFGA